MYTLSSWKSPLGIVTVDLLHQKHTRTVGNPFTLLVLYRFYCFIGVPLRKKIFKKASLRLEKLLFVLRNKIPPVVFFFLKINLRVSHMLFVSLAYCPFLNVQINYSIINRNIKNRYGKIEPTSSNVFFIRGIEWYTFGALDFV